MLTLQRSRRFILLSSFLSKKTMINILENGSELVGGEKNFFLSLQFLYPWNLLLLENQKEYKVSWSFRIMFGMLMFLLKIIEDTRNGTKIFTEISLRKVSFGRHGQNYWLRKLNSENSSRACILFTCHKNQQSMLSLINWLRKSTDTKSLNAEHDNIGRHWKKRQLDDCVCVFSVW